MTQRTKAAIVYYTGLAISIAAPLIVALCVFPFWKETDGKQVCGMIFIMALVCAVPLFKHIKIKLKSPSAFVMWVIMLGVLVALNTVLQQMIYVAFAGTISNAVGSVLFYVAKRMGYIPQEVNNGQDTE